ncbi:hypothetical protein AB0D54_12010 [Streptomyces xanthophaeus]|uniref:hypothetical protein n=1 Tax=Streptomyces xanthophaeus TaxID=67385 RepID=UPI0034311ADB
MGGAPAEAASAAVRHLKELAQQRPGEVELLEGFTETAMDGWTVAVPEDTSTPSGRAAAGASTTATGPWPMGTSARAR